MAGLPMPARHKHKFGQPRGGSPFPAPGPHRPYLKACISLGLFPEGWQAVSAGNRKRRRKMRWLGLRISILWQHWQRGLPFRAQRSCL